MVWREKHERRCAYRVRFEVLERADDLLDEFVRLLRLSDSRRIEERFQAREGID